MLFKIHSLCFSLLVEKKMSSKTTYKLQMAPEYCLSDISPWSTVLHNFSYEEWTLATLFQGALFSHWMLLQLKDLHWNNFLQVWPHMLVSSNYILISHPLRKMYIFFFGFCMDKYSYIFFSLSLYNTCNSKEVTSKGQGTA